MKLRCILGIHCWHYIGEEIHTFEVIRHGKYTDESKWHFDVSRCCNCGKNKYKLGLPCWSEPKIPDNPPILPRKSTLETVGFGLGDK